jgi:integrase
MKLTTAIARNLSPPSGKTDHIEWDEDFPGFGVRLRAGLNKVSRMWIYQFDFAGRTRRITIGNVIAIGIEDARKIAGQHQGEVRRGHDPVGEKAKSLARAAVIFADVLKNFLEVKKQTNRKGTYRATRDYLGEPCKLLHPMSLPDITRRDIARVLTPIAARGTKAAYNHVRGKLSAFFNWAITQGLTENNPVLGTEKQKVNERTRVLSMDELTALSHTLNDMTNYDFIIDLLIKAELYGYDSIMADMAAYHDILHLLMLTGQRRSEISELPWSEIRTQEIFIDDGLPVTGPAIVLSPERVKNGRKHIVPLSKPAQDILLRRRHFSDGGLVFQRKFNGKEHYAMAWSRHKRLLQAALEKNGHHFEPWVLHDLRRSVATHMGHMGILPHVIEEVLNHFNKNTYNKSKLEGPKREALKAWGEYLMAHIEGRAPADDKVTPIRA